MVIVEENHSRTEAMLGMPHLASWASQYGQATAYKGVTHPSLPNYLAIGGGSTFGVADDNGPSSHPISGASVFGQTLAAGETAKTYAETMPGNCDLGNSGDYAVKHNEWPYFTDSSERAGCNANDVPMGTTSSGNLLNDINSGNLPVTGQMTPNLCNDAHDCSLATADTWLNGWVPKLMSGPDYKAGNLTIVITFDEDDSSASNNVPFVVIDPRLSGKTVSTAANHYSLTRWLDENAGVSLLRNAATASDLKSAFGL
jgi:acid phosphatase